MNVTPTSLTSRDFEHFPQLKPTVTHSDRTVRASARTYFYATEKKCDDVMKNFLSCVNMAGKFWSFYYLICHFEVWTDFYVHNLAYVYKIYKHVSAGNVNPTTSESGT